MAKHIIIVHLDIQSFNVTLKGHKPQKHKSRLPEKGKKFGSHKIDVMHRLASETSSESTYLN